MRSAAQAAAVILAVAFPAAAGATSLVVIARHDAVAVAADSLRVYAGGQTAGVCKVRDACGRLVGMSGLVSVTKPEPLDFGDAAAAIACEAPDACVAAAWIGEFLLPVVRRERVRGCVYPTIAIVCDVEDDGQVTVARAAIEDDVSLAAERVPRGRTLTRFEGVLEESTGISKDEAAKMARDLGVGGAAINVVARAIADCPDVAGEPIAAALLGADGVSWLTTGNCEREDERECRGLHAATSAIAR